MYGVFVVVWQINCSESESESESEGVFPEFAIYIFFTLFSE